MKKLNPVPKRIRCPIEQGGKIEEIIDKFFIETKEHIENKYGKSPAFEIKSFWLANQCYFSTNKDDNAMTDERVKYVLYQDRIVAGVIERRTEFNHADYTFFRDLSKLEKFTKNHNNP
jgi:hypothetical protein